MSLLTSQKEKDDDIGSGIRSSNASKDFAAKLAMVSQQKRKSSQRDDDALNIPQQTAGD